MSMDTRQTASSELAPGPSSFAATASASAVSVCESYEVRRIPTWARLVDVPTNRARELREGMAQTLRQLKAAAESTPN